MKKFADLQVSEKYKNQFSFQSESELLLGKLLDLSELHNKILINIIEFTDILSFNNILSNNDLKFEPQTNRYLLNNGWYATLNNMKIFVYIGIPPGEYCTENEFTDKKYRVKLKLFDEIEKLEPLI